MAGSVNDKMKEYVETWESVSPTTNYFVRLDHRGEEKYEGVQGTRKFKLTTYERVITQDKIVDPKLDPFKNGAFRPLLVPEEVSVETNPNALSDEDIDRIFQASEFAWGEYMKVVDSPATLRRMVERAENAEISLQRYRELEKRLDTVEAKPGRVVQKDQDLYDNLGGQALTPSATPRTRRKASS